MEPTSDRFARSPREIVDLIFFFALLRYFDNWGLLPHMHRELWQDEHHIFGRFTTYIPNNTRVRSMVEFHEELLPFVVRVAARLRTLSIVCDRNSEWEGVYFVLVQHLSSTLLHITLTVLGQSATVANPISIDLPLPPAFPPSLANVTDLRLAHISGSTWGDLSEVLAHLTRVESLQLVQLTCRVPSTAQIVHLPSLCRLMVNFENLQLVHVCALFAIVAPVALQLDSGMDSSIGRFAVVMSSARR
ncbi:hypothetical protein B0H17DRAFT_1180924 [Mycena rosella]|uniref:F-box domain-containing protein n=1 Tax=Mycena rosella TaxID=1033263 RepID=A0AAD7GG49_MYCRO|nr:hypothetical protein B0H17DRAFT_1180924 [Mycena rosella]